MADAHVAGQWDAPIARSTGLSNEGLPAHVYHLMPRGLSKGLAVRWDLERRGLDPADAIAIGDSISDLEMADSVGRLWLTANGLADPDVAVQAAARANVTVCDEAVDLGWARAIRSILTRASSGPSDPRRYRENCAFGACLRAVFAKTAGIRVS